MLSRAFRGPTEARAVAKLEIPRWSEVSGGYDTSPQNAMKVPAFFRCVDIVASTVAILPFKAYRKTKSGREEVESKLIDSPYPGIVQMDWMWILMLSLATAGNAFGYITSRDERGFPQAILPVAPDSVRVDPEEGTWAEPVYYIGDKRVDSADMFHVKAYPRPGHPMGYSPLEYLASTLDLASEAQRYGLRWFRDSATPSGILSTEAELTPTQVQHEMKNWIKTHGRGKRYPAILGGGLKWQSISITPEESQFLLTRAQQRADIAMVFGVPPHMIGDTEKTSSWGTGVAEQVLGFQKFTIARFVTRIEQAFNPLLPRGQFSKFNMDALLRPDPETRSRMHQIAIQNSYASPNEVRAQEEMPAIPNGDIFMMPANFRELGPDPEQPNSPSPDASGEIGDSQ